MGGDGMKTILFDLDGVLYTGNKAIEGAADVISWCNDSAIPHLYLTNTTSKKCLQTAIQKELNKT